MQWEQEDGFLQTDLQDLNSLVSHGAFRFLSNNQKIANACLYDDISQKYRLGYVIETEDKEFNNSYTFKVNSALNYTLPFKDLKKIKAWCVNQKLLTR